MKLLALILAYMISHFITKPGRFRQFKWFKSWSDWFIKGTNLTSHETTVVLIVALPVLIISFLLFNLSYTMQGGLIIAILVLSYCIGPESFEEDVESGDIRNKLGIRKNAKSAVLIRGMTNISLKRWFGVFFWYIVLGVVGAIIYRLSERMEYNKIKGNQLNPAIDKLMQILNYPVAWMMVISLAIASDFERIYKKCKSYLTIDNIKMLDTTFLYEATDFAVENCEVENENKKNIELVTISVLKRMLVVWLVVVAILVIIAV